MENKQAHSADDILKHHLSRIDKNGIKPHDAYKFAMKEYASLFAAHLLKEVERLKAEVETELSARKRQMKLLREQDDTIERQSKDIEAYKNRIRVLEKFIPKSENTVVLDSADERLTTALALLDRMGETMINYLSAKGGTNMFPLRMAVDQALTSYDEFKKGGDDAKSN